jgi:hydrogenase/urease accessory protein HupE
MRVRLAIGIVMFAIGGVAHGDVFRPAYLELRELGDDRFDVLWKVPMAGADQRLALYVTFPEGTATVTEPRVVATGGAWVERYRIERTGGLVGEQIVVAGRAAGVSDVIARLERLDGSSQVERLALETPSFVVAPAAGRGEIAWSYLVLGVEHILGGIDHLLFVLALLLVVKGGRRIVATVTAFTVAHSITLVAATIGWVHVAGPPVEAIIALSIVFVASEVVQNRRGRPGLTARSPWLVAFSFGLLHGLGFAGALAEVGLPEVAIPLALLMFNVGVELGQLAFVAVVLALGFVAGRLGALPRWGAGVAAYSIGAVAAFWAIERVAAFWA